MATECDWMQKEKMWRHSQEQETSKKEQDPSSFSTFQSPSNTASLSHLIEGRNQVARQKSGSLSFIPTSKSRVRKRKCRAER